MLIRGHRVLMKIYNTSIRAPATVRHCRQFRKKYWIGDYGLAVGENFGALVFSSIHSHFHIIVVATIILCSPDICVYPPPSRKDENSSQRKPNHPVYNTPTSSNWDNISAGGGTTNYFFSRSCIFHGYFLFNLAPRGPQLATKMAPAFLGLAGPLSMILILELQGPQNKCWDIPVSDDILVRVLRFWKMSAIDFPTRGW